MTDPGHPPSTIDRPEFDDLAVALSIELDRPVRELQPEVALSVAFPEALDRYRLHLVPVSYTHLTLPTKRIV